LSEIKIVTGRLLDCFADAEHPGGLAFSRKKWKRKNMLSNERSSYGRRPYQNQGYGQSSYGSPKPHVQEDTLKSAEVPIERKMFVFTLKENPRGRFLRITEDVNGRRDSIIVPSTGLAEFKKAVDEMTKASDDLPAKAQPQAQ
jgi:hypothetical protein